MKGFKELSAVALSLLAFTVSAEEAAAAAAEEVPSDVHVLKTDTFETFVKENPLVLAEFYAPWCGHCKALAPEYEDAATKLKGKGIPLAKIDCTVETELCEKQGVQGYPTVKVFRGPDNVAAYGGQRKSDAIVSYMIKQSLPAVSILDKDSHEEFTKADKVVLVAYFGADDRDTNATYSQVAESLRDSYLFGATSDAALAKAAGVELPALVLYKSFDEGKTVYDGKFEVEEIMEFAKVASTPLVGEVGPDTYAGYMDAGIPLAYIFVDNDADKEKYTKAVKPFAEKFRGKINFATIDAAAFGAHAQNLNLEQKWPAFAIQETGKNLKYPFNQETEMTEKALAKFIEDFSSGNIKPSIKSEPVPKKQEGPVHVVVADNYEEIVMDAEKDVLVEFYAPWCGHCKNLAPKYEELGKLYFDNKVFSSKVIIAKVDATANDVPIEIQGFPTIKLFPAGSKTPVDYTGSRTVEDLANFVKEHGTHKVDAYVAPPVESVAEEAEGVASSATAAASKVSEKAEEKTETASEKVKDATEKVKDATEKVKEAAETVKEEVTEKVKEATTAASSAVAGGHDEL